MDWSSAANPLLLLHELAHMNGRARARHRVAAASVNSEHRQAHEEAAVRHEGFAEALAARQQELAGLAVPRSARVASDAQSGADARRLIAVGRLRLIAKYEQALAETLDTQTHDLIDSQYQALRREWSGARELATQAA